MCKRLWQQIVVAKIHAQAANLPSGCPARQQLLALKSEVKSGDTTKVEARAARIYWAAWCGDAPDFRRDPDAEDALNNFLNYGYAVLRAAVTRALVSAGLHPALGLHHRHRGNAFCLADDLMEPLRPLVDRAARQLRRDGHTELKPPAKAELLKLLAVTVRIEDQTGPLMVALHRTAASLGRCFERLDSKLVLHERAEEEP